MAAIGDAATGRPTAIPTRKVAGGGLTGAACTVAVWLYDALGLPGTPVPPEVVGCLTTLAGFAAAYAIPPASIETVVATKADEAAMGQFYG